MRGYLANRIFYSVEQRDVHAKRKISNRTSGIHSAYHPTSKTFFRQRVFHKIGKLFGEIFMVGTNDYIS
jgi:hypothetical protein